MKFFYCLCLVLVVTCGVTHFAVVNDSSLLGYIAGVLWVLIFFAVCLSIVVFDPEDSYEAK